MIQLSKSIIHLSTLLFIHLFFLICKWFWIQLSKFIIHLCILLIHSSHYLICDSDVNSGSQVDIPVELCDKRRLITKDTRTLACDTTYMMLKKYIKLEEEIVTWGRRAWPVHSCQWARRQASQVNIIIPPPVKYSRYWIRFHYHLHHGDTCEIRGHEIMQINGFRNTLCIYVHLSTYVSVYPTALPI